MASFTASVVADWRQQGVSTIDSTGPDLRVRTHPSAGSQQRAALQFDLGAEGVSQGDTINSATIDIELALVLPWEEMHSNVYGEDADTASTNVVIGTLPHTTATVSWVDTTGGAAGTVYTSPDIASVIQEVVNRPSWDGGKVNILLDQELSGGAPPPGSFASSENPTYTEAKLTVNYTASSSGDNAVTLSAPSAAASVTGAAPTPYEVTDVDARDGLPMGTNWDGVGVNTSRGFDIWIPEGEAPADGWPLVAWAHSGFWSSGNRAQIPASLVTLLNNAGFAVVSVGYHKTIITAIGTERWWSNPMQVLDYKASIVTIAQNNGLYNIDWDRFYATGYSAGGHLALFASLTAAYSDGATYDGIYRNGTVNDTAACAPHVNDGSPNEFSFREAVWDASIETDYEMPTPAGAFVWGAPVDVWEAAVDIAAAGDGDGGKWARSALMYYTTNSRPGVDRDEVDINHYLVGSNDTAVGPYDGGVRAAPSIPIGYVQGADSGDYTDDGVVSADSGVTALYDALNTTGYDVSSAVNTVSATGLTRFQNDVYHDFLDTDAGTQDRLLEWLGTVDPEYDYSGSSDAGATLEAPEAGASAGAATATAVSDNGVTLTAPEAGASAGAASATAVSDNGVTLTAPEAGVSAGAATAEGEGNAGTTLVAPEAGASAGAASAAGVSDNGATLSAPEVGASAGTASAEAVSDAGVTLAAPEAGASAGVATGFVSGSPSVTLSAPEVGASAGAVSAAVQQDAGASLSAPEVGASASSVSLIVDAAVSITAPGAVVAAAVAAAEGGSSTGTTLSAPSVGAVPGATTGAGQQDAGTVLVAPAVDAFAGTAVGSSLLWAFLGSKMAGRSWRFRLKG